MRRSGPKIKIFLAPGLPPGPSTILNNFYGANPDRVKPVQSHRFAYAVRLTPAAEDGYGVTCRDLPPLITQGEDCPDALAQAADVRDELVAALMRGKHDLPVASRRRRGEVWVAPPTARIMQAADYVANRVARVRA